MSAFRTAVSMPPFDIVQFSAICATAAMNLLQQKQLISFGGKITDVHIIITLLCLCYSHV